MSTKMKVAFRQLMWWIFTTVLCAGGVSFTLGYTMRYMADRSIPDWMAFLIMVPVAILAAFCFVRQWCWGLKIWKLFKEDWV